MCDISFSSSTKRYLWALSKHFPCIPSKHCFFTSIQTTQPLLALHWCSCGPWRFVAFVYHFYFKFCFFILLLLFFYFLWFCFFFSCFMLHHFESDLWRLDTLNSAGIRISHYPQLSNKRYGSISCIVRA